MFTDGSDYIVEQYIKPTKVRKRIINDERADLLGNFDDDDTKFMKKKTKAPKPTVFASEEDPFADAADESENEQIKDENDEKDLSTAEHDSDSNSDSDVNATAEESDDKTVDSANVETDEAEVQEDASQCSTTKAKKSNRKTEKTPKNLQKSMSLTDDQIKALIRGSSKKDRFVLYVTNLNYSTTREALTEFFEAAGTVKSVRVPKVRRSAFAFVEMSDIDGFKNALTFHNRTLDNYTIKVQISEAGKKKSANKKNILKQKNRKLAEMRNETKQFQRSGKGYDKTIKKEIRHKKLQQDRRLARKNKSANKK